jgi:subtilisin family serine protease
MKQAILLLVMLAHVVSDLFAQSDFFYSSNGEKEIFKIRKDKVILKSKSVTGMQKILQKTSISSAYSLGENMVIASIDTLAIRMDTLIQTADVADVAYFLEYADGILQAPTNKIFVKPQKAQSLDSLFNKIGFSKNIISTKLINPQHGIYLVELNVKLGDVLSIVRELFETNTFEFVEPSFVRQLKSHNTYYSHQWGLKNTGQNGGTSGIDINAEAAWGITRGSDNIKVAVIDDGIDLTHPDLQANLLSGFDATVNAPGGANGSPYGNNAHGTACAGIIGAINNTIGIVGVAPASKIIPVRIAYDLYGNGWTTNDEWIANGIQYAWDTSQADILSNSWGGGSNSSTINAEIANAVTYGRNGKGCVIVFASGNNGVSPVSYPANLSDVIATGANTRNGQRATFSNYGTDLDVVAPGVDIYTTDRQGNAGYVSGDYYASFSGTSAACPHVAGIAALILSVRPDLTQAQVRQAIESTCTKLSGYSFSTNSNHSNGTWNNQVGHGLVNAYAAVNLVAPKIAGPSSPVCSNTVTFTVNNAPAGYTWGHSSSLTLASTSGNTATFSKNGSGFVNASVSIIVGGVTVATKNFLMSVTPDISSITVNIGCESGYYYGHIPNSSTIANNMGIEEFEWRGTSSDITIEPYPGGYIYVPGDRVRIVYKYYGGVEVRARNACGWSNWKWVTALSSPCSSTYSMTASPNPVNTIMDINITPNENVLQNQNSHGQTASSQKNVIPANPVYEIKLYNNTGSLVRQTISTTGNITLDVSNLPNGLYILHVHDGADNPPQTQNIIISH